MYSAIVLLPLLGSLITAFSAPYVGSLLAARIATSSVLLSFVFSLIAFKEVAILGSPCYIDLFPWILSGYVQIHWGFMFDSLTVMMLVVVTSISSLVHLYSIGYMSNDPHIPRFFSYLSIFTFFMLILVTANNLVQLFVGWEGVGVSSYLLINFWFTRIQANKSAMKAMIVNRIGDFGLSLGIFVLFFVFRTVDFETLFALSSTLMKTNLIFLSNNIDAITLISILLFVGSIGKSAQVGLHTWLPDAMEGPTPVSALIHAATMVTAGVFLLLRCSPLIEYAPDALLIIAVIGSLTAFFAATTGIVQNDLKRIIAYSTCSQLGYMIFACGLSNYSVSAFHLMNHAFFKALLFLSAGSIIHAMSDEQDIRKMGRLTYILPITYILMFVASLSLMGIPFLTGFYSKDVILELSYANYTLHGSFTYWIGSISAFCTAFYSIRLIYHVFWGKRARGFRSYYLTAHESPNIMLVPLLILGVASVFIGYLLKDMMIGLGTNFWGNSLFTHPYHLSSLDAEFLPVTVKNIPVKYSIFGGLLAFILNLFFSSIWTPAVITGFGKYIYTLLNRKWFFDNVYNHYIVRPMLQVGYHVTFRTLDRGFIEVFGPSGIGETVKRLSNVFSRIHSGFVYHYLVIFIIGVILLTITIIGQPVIPYFDFRVSAVWLILIGITSLYL